MKNSLGSPFMFSLWFSDNKWSHFGLFVSTWAGVVTTQNQFCGNQKTHSCKQVFSSRGLHPGNECATVWASQGATFYSLCPFTLLGLFSPPKKGNSGTDCRALLSLPEITSMKEPGGWCVSKYLRYCFLSNCWFSGLCSFTLKCIY